MCQCALRRLRCNYQCNITTSHWHLVEWSSVFLLRKNVHRSKRCPVTLTGTAWVRFLPAPTHETCLCCSAKSSLMNLACLHTAQESEGQWRLSRKNKHGPSARSLHNGRMAHWVRDFRGLDTAATGTSRVELRAGLPKNPNCLHG